MTPNRLSKLRSKWVVAALLAALALVATPRLAAAQSATEQDVKDCEKYLEEGKFAKAAKKCDSAIKRDPKGVSPGGYALRATLFLLMKKYEDGVKWIETVAEKNYPGDPLILEQKAALLSKVPGRGEESIKAAEAAVAKDKKRFVAQKLLAEYYYKAGAGKAKEAAAAFEAYLAARPEASAKSDGIVLLQLGYTYMHLGKAEGDAKWHKKAEETFDRALKVAGGDATVGPGAQKGKCASLVARGKLEANPQLFDKAITVCESVIKARKGMKGDASPYYNVGQAYLERNQLDRAVNAANSYIQQKPDDYRGYLLRGKIFFRQQKYNEAENQFARAAELAAKNNDPNNVDIALARGKNFLQQKQAGKDIALLEKVAAARPDVDVLTELARAYYVDKQNVKAANTAEKALQLPGQAENAPLLVLAGDAYLASAELKTARDLYTRAYKLNKNDVRARTGIIDTTVLESFVLFQKGNLAGAEKLLLEGLAVDPASLMVNYDLGLIALDNGKFQDAVKYLTVRYKKAPNDLLTNRLLAKAHLSLGQNAEAEKLYAAAEKLALAERANTVLAEIYIEWAPLLLAAGKTEDAVEKLEVADQYSSDQSFQKAAQRNLQLAYFRRGYERWRARKTNEALADLEGAVRYPANLTKGEEDAFTFALGLAYLSANQAAKAQPIFQKYSKAGVLPFLKAPWDKVGADFFMAYALYREGTAASRKQAAQAFGVLLPKVTGNIAVKAKQLLRSSWEFVAWDAWPGDAKGAGEALKKAAGFATANEKAVIDHNTAVLNFKNSQAVFQRLGSTPPEALVNLGIHFDMQGDARKAYDLWVAARAQGVKSANLDVWIDAKKRIFNF